MSTRATIIIKDSSETLYFYRHSDGYPETTGNDLKEFCKEYDFDSGRFRNNPAQSAGWLIVHGYYKMREDLERLATEWAPLHLGRDSGYDWKVGYYEPTDCIHSDVEFIYVIDLDEMTLETREPSCNSFFEKPSLELTSVIETHSIAKKLKRRGAK